MEAKATGYSTTGKPKNVDFSQLPSVNRQASNQGGGNGTSGETTGATDNSGSSQNASSNDNGSKDLFVAEANKAGHLYLYNDNKQQLVYRVPTTTIENARTQPTTKGTRVCPGINGGVEWYGPAYDPTDQHLYTGSVDWCSTFTLGEVRYTPGQFFFAGSFSFDPVKDAKGWIDSFDAKTGRLDWKYESHAPIVASVTPTAGKVLFTGSLDGNFLVLDSRTGKDLYSFYTGGPIGAGIATYKIDGRQYVAVPSGNMSRTWSPNSSPSATVFIFALPKSAEAKQQRLTTHPVDAAADRHVRPAALD